jgi:hypothetical protein
MANMVEIENRLVWCLIEKNEYEIVKERMSKVRC